MTERYWVRRALKHSADDYYDKLEAENDRLIATLKSIAEYCSGDDPSRGATARLAAVGNTAEQALRVHEQSASKED